WGVVTNKPKRFTEPLLDALDLTSRAACIISGDSLENKKPHPQPIYHACDMVDCQPQQCVYIGDAERDIQAGRNAGTFTLVALFGYIHNQQQPHTWGADHMVQSPEEILPWIDKLNSQSSSTETNSYAGQN
ncbi:HAD family hydrolase, partial [Kaarinaea lacus]